MAKYDSCKTFPLQSAQPFAGVRPPGAFAAQGPVQRQTGSTGSIGVTLRFDLPQTAENASGRDIRLQISGSAGQTTISLPAGTAKANELATGIYTEVKNVDGEALTTEERVGYYQAELTGLTAGQTYTVKLTGTGYKPFQTTVTLDEYSKHRRRHLLLGRRQR